MKERLIELIGEFVDIDRPPFGIKWVEFLADHLLANGVIVPPVKVRQKVWLIGYTGTLVEKNPCVIEGEVYAITISELNYKFRGVFECRAEINGEGEWFDLLFDEVGKTVFLTQEEAERALTERSKS